MKPADPSPLLRWVSPLALAVWIGAVLARTQSSGAGQELHTPGAQVFFDALAFTALALACVEAFLERRPGLRLELPLAGSVVVVALLFAAGSAAPDPEFGWRTALSWSAAGALGLGAALLAGRGGRARWLGATLLASVTLGAASGLYQYFVEFPALQRQLEAGTLRELSLYEADFQQGLRERIYGAAATGPWLLPNLLACAIAMVFPLGVVFTVAQRGARRALGVGVCATLVLALLATESEGGVLAWLAGAGALAVLHPRWRRLRMRLIGGVAAFGALGAMIGGVAFARAREAEGVGLSLTVRLEYWAAGWAMWTDSPWVGHGLNAFRALYPRYKLASAEETLHAHNGGLQLLVELGVLGVLVLAAAAGLWAWRAIRDAPATDLAAAGDDRWGVVGGVLFGGLVLLAGGDVLGLSLALPVTLFGVAAIAWGLAEGAPIPADRWRSALAAGWVGFAVDSLTDFGLHHAGCLAAALVLAGLARAGAGPGPEEPPLPAARPAWPLGAATALASVAALVCVIWAQPPMRADTEREEARALHLEGADLALRGLRARAEEALGASRTAYDAAVEAYPEFADSYRERAAVARALGDPRQAVADLQRAAELRPQSSTIRNELGHALLEQGSLEPALVAFDEALERYPYHPQFLLDAAEARAKSPELAIRTSARGYARRALEASDATRLQLRKLTQEQRARAEALAR